MSLTTRIRSFGRIRPSGRARLLGVAVVLAALSAGSFVVAPAIAQDAPPAPRAPRGPAAPAASLEANMKTMNRAYKTIGRQIDDAAKDAETLKLVGDLQAATAAAKGQVPHGLEEKPAQEREQAIAEYRKAMLASLKQSIALEEALVAGDRAAAKAAYAEIDATMKAGHKAFRVDHDH